MEDRVLTLKQIRILFDENITQEEYANKLGINPRRYQDLESGRVKLLAVEMLAISSMTNIATSSFKLD